MTTKEIPATHDRHDFRLFWLGGAANLLGSHASALVLPIVVLAVGGSPLAAGLLGTVGATVEVLVTPFAGVYADRGSRRGLMAVALVVAAIATGTVAIGIGTHIVSLPLLFACTVVTGAATAVYTAAASGAIRAVLPSDRPEAALGALQAREQAAKLAGPGVGGGLYQLVAWVPFLADAVSFLVATVCVLAIRSDLRPIQEPDAEPAAKPNFRAEFAAGLRFLWYQPFLRFVMLWAGGVNLVFGALYFEVILVARLRGTPAGAIGLVLTVAGAAGLAGALLAPLVLRRVRAAVLVVVASWVMAVVVLLFALPVSIWVDGALLGVVSLLTPALSIVFQSKAIMLTPDRLQSRVGTALSTMGEGTGALAPLLAGVLVATLHPATVAVLFACCLALLAAYTSINVRRLGEE